MAEFVSWRIIRSEDNICASRHPGGCWGPGKEKRWIPACAHGRQLEVLRPTGLNNIAQGPLTNAFMYPFRVQMLNLLRSRGGATLAPGWFIQPFQGNPLLRAIPARRTDRRLKTKLLS